MITLNHLTYAYRRGQTAISNASAEIAPGIHLLLGENGAGKTTLLRLIAGMLFPESGSVFIGDSEMSRRGPATLSKVFMLPESITIPTATIKEFAEAHSRFYPTFSQELFEENLREFQLDGNEKFNQLSFGLRHKSLLAYAIALGVEVLLLDEPTNGLDITSKKAFRNMLARCTGPEQTVIVSTHTVSDLKELYDGVIILSHSDLLLACESWKISEKISCVSSSMPPKEALFTEQGAGVFHSIIPTRGDEESALNYQLLYSAIMSPARDKIISHINS